MSQTNTLVAPFEYICQTDEAVDRPDAGDAAAVEAFELAWKHYRDGMGEPPLKADMKPLRIRLRHLTAVEQTYIRETWQGGEGERTRGALTATAMMALVSVSGRPGLDGKPIAIKHEVTPWGLVRIRHATAESLSVLLDALGGGDAPLLEIGSLVSERSAVRPSS